jgi:hypothetical protein
MSNLFARFDREIPDRILTEQELRRQLTASQSNRENMENFLQVAHNKPFWLWGQKHHETHKFCKDCGSRYPENTPFCECAKFTVIEDGKEIVRHHETLRYNDELILGQRECCFNHLIGLPIKPRKDFNTGAVTPDTMPIFNWQEEIYKTFRSGQDYLYIKTTGMGWTELKLRDIACECSTSYKWSKAQIPIILGPKELLAILLINRFKELFPFVIPTDMKTAVVNGCWIHTFASDNIGTIRSLKNVIEVVIDEFDHFQTGEMDVVLTAIFRYIAKSGSVIRAASTPNRPGGFCETLERKPGKFKIIKIHWTKVYGTIFTEREIQEQKKAPGFEQEYGLQYLGGHGNWFSPELIDDAINPDYKYQVPVREAITLMGVDTGYTEGSKFAIIICSTFNYKIHVMYAKQFENPQGKNMVAEIKNQRLKYEVDKIMVDGSDPAFIYDLKEELKEYPTDYHLVDKEEYRHMIVEPVTFTKQQYEYLVHDKRIFEDRGISIHPDFNDLIIGLRSAYVEVDEFIKEKSVNNDLVDALSIALRRFKPKTITVRQ